MQDLAKQDHDEWPLRNLERIFQHGDGQDAARRARLQALFSTGLIVAGDYSGLWGDRECLEQTKAALKMWPGWDVDMEKAIHHVRSCDKDSTCKVVLKHWATEVDNGKSCVFDDLFDRLPPWARVWVEGAVPAADASPEVAVAAHTDIFQYLHKHRELIFPRTAVSPCLVHGKDCCVDVLSAFQEQQVREAKELTAKQARFEDVDAEVDVADPVSRPWVISGAGTTCVGWSPAGKQQQFADPSEAPHAVYLVERIAKAEDEREDVFLQENSERYRYKEKLVEPLGSTHLILAIRWSPEDGGHPVRKPRTFAAGLNLRTTAWLGPDPDDIQEDFQRFFGRVCEANAGHFLQAGPEMVQEKRKAMAANRGHHIGDDELDNLPLDAMCARLMPPCMLMRYRKHRLARLAIGEPEPWFADLEQDFKKGASTPGSILPSHLTHGTMWVWAGGTERPVHPLESLYGHGFLVFPSKFRCNLLDIFLQLGGRGLTRLCGNGHHLPTMAAWQLYILCHIVRLDRRAVAGPHPWLRKSSSWFVQDDVEQDDGEAAEVPEVKGEEEEQGEDEQEQEEEEEVREEDLAQEQVNSSEEKAASDME